MEALDILTQHWGNWVKHTHKHPLVYQTTLIIGNKLVKIQDFISKLKIYSNI